MRKRKLTKMLGLSLLAILAVMAMNAVAAQANFLLLKNGAASSPVNLNAVLPEVELLVPGENLNIKCTGGSATSTLSQSGTTVIITVTTTSTGCVVLKFEKTCLVHSKGLANGTIVASGSGLVDMVSTTTFALLENPEWTFIQILGALCPLEDIEQPISGSIILTILEPQVSLLEHVVHLDDEELFYGEEPMELDGPGGSDTATMKVKEASDQKWAIDLN